jgi:hypothetical protein
MYEEGEKTLQAAKLLSTVSTVKWPPGPLQNHSKAYEVNSRRQWHCTTFVLPAVFCKLSNLEGFRRRATLKRIGSLTYFYEISPELSKYKSFPVSVGTHYVFSSFNAVQKTFLCKMTLKCQL